MQSPRTLRPRVHFGLILLAILAVGIIAIVAWAWTPALPMPEARAAMLSDGSVVVTQSPRWITFTPLGSTPERGLIFYPGGRIEVRSYAPAARALAARGVLVVLVKMPLNLAVLAPDRAAAVQASYPDVAIWAIGGHSLGGAMAASYVFKHPGAVQGLLLWAAYPAGNNSLVDNPVRVLSISASLDGLSTPEKIEASRALLPADTIWYTVEGGNHAQFGWYGPQAGDNPAVVSRDDQQNLVVQRSAAFILELEP